MNKLKKIPVVLLIILAASGCKNNHTDKKFSNEKTEEKTTEFTQEIIQTTEITAQAEEIPEEATFDNPELVEYMTIARLLEDQNIETYGDPSMCVVGFELSNIDNDDDIELLMKVQVVDSDAQDGYANIYITLDGAAGIYSEWYTQNTERTTNYLFDKINSAVYLEDINSDNNDSYDSINCWTEDGWQPKMKMGKNDQGMEEAIWEGENISQEEWKKRKSEIMLREIENDMQDCRAVYTDAKVNNVMETLQKYFTDKGIETTTLEKNDKEKYLIVHNNLWENKKNIDDIDQSIVLMNYIDYHLSCYKYIFVVRETELGTKIFSDELGYLVDEVSSYYYSDGIVIDTGDIKTSYVYEFSDDDFGITRKLYYSDVESDLISKKWYTISKDFYGNEVIGLCEFHENSQLTYSEYIQNFEGEWEKSNSETDSYMFTEDDNTVFIFFAAALSSSYTYMDSEHIVSGLKSKNGDIDGNCFVSYDNFPEYEDLKQRCSSYLNEY